MHLFHRWGRWGDDTRIHPWVVQMKEHRLCYVCGRHEVRTVFDSVLGGRKSTSWRVVCARGGTEDGQSGE